MAAKARKGAAHKRKKGGKRAAPIDPTARYTIPEALEHLKFSRALLFQRVAKGLLRTQQDGGRTFITGAELHRYITQPTIEAPAPEASAA